MTSSIEATTTGPCGLSAGEIECLRCVAGHMIPASAVHGVPGADDDVILADMIRSPGRDGAALAALLRRIDAAAGGRLAALDAAVQVSLLSAMRAEEPAALAVLEAVVCRAYYRDDRVLASIGMEARPPFPLGYKLPTTDWSLLDPVRQRGPLWRPAD
ncbi:hypothetical protein [Aquibium sp. ELW1220]|uniref:hypothetical protein n=1 Tax=Aquibium sp. ELW1220 TaxID=2976766 RepID=UPI0025B0A33B|nr:hypothetical protein [Aquibium sp. ELW1220]MDN2582905.1 hypothetical protein [Aquibium sp. ELW1220]